jgi:hypothetical protein
MARRVDPIKAKAKRDKIIAGVLGGVLLVALAVSVPFSLKQWKKVNGGGEPARAAAPTTTTPAPGAAPSLPGSTPSQGIAATVASPVGTDELHAFDLFESKDPFAPQVDDAAAPGSSGAPARPPDAEEPRPAPGLTPTSPGSPGTKPPPLPTPTQAVVSVNGAPAELLTVGSDFPLPPAEALFHLVSLTPGKARISIVGGSYADGSATVTLRRGRTLTLENTADGTRYELKLLWVGAGAPPAGLVPAAQPAATPPPATVATAP